MEDDKHKCSGGGCKKGGVVEMQSDSLYGTMSLRQDRWESDAQ